ncbi:hypothetical protein M885DRAFT_496248 [Pelagophyceae sp. CCMP2097]|nr:hypothetical protein M885DRAFT_496248 [Pelagophyceae sp. CCMP2097]|mmetsp:Transcript_10996/g.38188  ORF Transcript_10996/g.38188 Transcript_10996/m.38188 type:complete len:159 (-) Transcript_10996:70-546(-)
MSAAQPRPPVPPFSYDDAVKKVRAAEDGWNTRDAGKVSLAYSEDTKWRNRAEFFQGRGAAKDFLESKWATEMDYRLIKEVWAHSSDRIAVRFAYECRNGAGEWKRAYGNENWEFDEMGLMRVRHASINDVAITEAERLFHWPLGRRPDDHASLSDLGL